MRKNKTSGNTASPVTQAFVAWTAGVSQQTVSQALSGTGRISDTVRQHVIDVAGRLEYRPNKQALALRNNTHGAIGLVGLKDNTRSFISSIFLQRLQISLLKINKYLAFVTVPSPDTGTMEVNPAKMGIDGAFVNITQGDIKPLLNVFQSAGMPEIWINNKLKYNSVYPDDYGAASRIVSFMVSQNYLGIGYYVGSSLLPGRPPESHYSVEDRYLGYMDAMAKAGLKPMTFSASEMTSDDLRSFLRMGQPSPVLLCYEFNQALHVLMAAKSAGIKIPAELKIIYFHSEPIWDDGIDSLLRCLPVPNDKIAEAAISMFGHKSGSNARNLKSVAVPYDDKYFKHTLTGESYFDIVKEG
ncbi:MAG TPA: hypothetical protein DET40_03910 [Lentisphaeria bacterium]|nr:MAG: hypothetical protein A2X45_15295 [Lentisphaerae bacterium GWF2_50_93]HCE42671.1 hypothetical protein [Lentisphaeria bacterium]